MRVSSCFSWEVYKSEPRFSLDRGHLLSHDHRTVQFALKILQLALISKFTKWTLGSRDKCRPFRNCSSLQPFTSEKMLKLKGDTRIREVLKQITFITLPLIFTCCLHNTLSAGFPVNISSDNYTCQRVFSISRDMSLALV